MKDMNQGYKATNAITRLPSLYSRTSKGGTQLCEIRVENEWIITRFGLLFMKMQEARKEAHPKNVGKANATTASEQAILEAVSMWKKKVDKGYKENLEDASLEVFLPMLAKSFDKRKHKMTYPCYVQPKLDGVRCLASWRRGEISLMSRSGKEYNIPHVKAELERTLPANLVLDGEVYAHGETFQTITSWVKKLRPETGKLEYHVYDCILQDDREASFCDRLAALTEFFSSGVGFPLSKVKTAVAKDEEEVYVFQSKCLIKGYEGAIARNATGPYKLKSRSDNLLKVKSFMDKEYRVVGCGSGRGKFSDCAIWVCSIEGTDKTFEALTTGTLAERREQLTNKEDYLGSWLKVKFFGLTDAGIPRFPVGLGFRMQEDM